MKIQWFPGHMNKTQNIIKGIIKNVDLIIEVLDARIPISSENPIINKISENKPKLVILNKADLADKKISNQWINYFDNTNEKIKTILISSKDKKAKNKIEAGCGIITGKKMSTALIMGIPNVGKSTIINVLTGRKKVNVGDKPAITRDFRKINIFSWLKIIDTPGILWHKFDDEEVGIKLAILGCIKDSVLNIEDTCINSVMLMINQYPGRIEERFKINNDNNDPIDILNKIGRKRGCLLAGGNINFEKVCNTFLYELRNGKLGAVSLEKPIY